MRGLRVILVSCVVWVVLVFLLLVVFPAYSQGPLPRSTYAPERLYVIEKNTTDAVWSLSKTINITFNLPNVSLSGYSVTTPFNFTLDWVSDAWAVRRINYAFLCNGEEFRHLQEDVVGTGPCKASGSYIELKQSIPSILLKNGENNFTLSISIVSMAEETGRNYFKLNIENLCVQKHCPDLDGDGILDIADPLLGVNNYVATVFFSAVGLPIVAFIGRKMPKFKRR